MNFQSLPPGGDRPPGHEHEHEHEHEHVLDIRGIRCHVWDGGPEDGPAVVLTHGAGADHHMFDAQVPALQAAGYRTVRWDVGGHGRSKPLPRPFLVREVVEDLARVLDHLGVERAVLVGQSMGGNVAQEFVASRRSRVLALVIIGSTFHTLPVTRCERWALRGSLVLLPLWPYRRLRRAMVRASAVTPEGREYLSRAFAQLDRAEFLAVWRGMVRLVDPRPDARSGVPLLLLLGEQDRTGNIAKTMRRWADLEGARLHVLPGAGHVANVDRAEEVNQLMIQFLCRVLGGQR